MWMDLSALVSLILYLAAILFCAFQLPRIATGLSWIALGLATLSGTLGWVPAFVFAALQLWMDYNPAFSLPRGLAFTGFMILTLFRVIPGIGSIAIQLPKAAEHPFSISWASVLVAWFVFRNITRTSANLPQKNRPWATLFTIGIPMGVIAAAVSWSFRWTGSLDFPLSAGWFFGWIILDLFFISVSDEALYRGTIMALILKFMGNTLPSWTVAVLSASSISALQHHFIGGDPLIGSFIVGLLFGMCFLLSGFLEAAIIAHFTCDALLLLLGIFKTN